VPLYLATLSPRALALTGELADGWLGTSFLPEAPEAHLAFLREGADRAGRSLAELDLCAGGPVAFGDDVERRLDARRSALAFTLGAMGSAGTNFYNDAFQRAGFVDDAKAIQSLWLAGKRQEAARRVPDAMVTEFGAIGTTEMVRERFELYARVGIDCLNVRMDSVPPADRFEALEQIVELLPGR